MFSRKKRKQNKYYDTGIELAIEAQLKLHNIAYQKQAFLHNLINVDFYIPDGRIVIEADGCYYHGCPTHHPRRKVQGKDYVRTQILTNAGYTVLRFWEHDINERIDWCTKRILKYARNKQQRKKH